MRHPTTLLAAVLALAGCGEAVPEASELEGIYEIVEREEGPCEGPLESDPPSPGNRYFELEAESDGGEELRLAFYECTGPDDCTTDADLRRSFGRTGGGWGATFATASTGCVLRFTRRELFLTEDGVEIVQTTYRERDESLTTDAECNDLEANRRGDRMPCVSVVETRAQRL